MLTYGSVCSGIEAASVAWGPLDWRPAFLSEIDKFPRAVLEHHYPETPLHGDFTTIEADQYAPIDLLVGGTPCQSFSIAGLRGGLDDNRGNLALQFFLLAQRTRPRWVVWENVPGVLSSKRGRDFGSILGALVELGYGFAYRVLDAQYVRVDGFGRAVPQRRRRVFVVGYLGDWRRAAAVLFERESLCGSSAPRREAGQDIAQPFEVGTPGGHRAGVSPALDTRCKDGPIRNQCGVAIVSATGADDNQAQAKHLIASTGDVSHCLNAGAMGRIDFESETFITVHGTQDPISSNGVAFPVGRNHGQETVFAFSCKDHGADAARDVSPTLRAMSHSESHANAGGQLAVAFDMRGRDGGAQLEGPHQTANIRAASGGASRSFVADPWFVRRLTPTECERLQGFPDGYTEIPYRGKPADRCPDGPRYKALGNSMAVNVMRWIGQRIQQVEDLAK